MDIDRLQHLAGIQLNEATNKVVKNSINDEKRNIMATYQKVQGKLSPADKEKFGKHQDEFDMDQDSENFGEPALRKHLRAMEDILAKAS